MELAVPVRDLDPDGGVAVGGGGAVDRVPGRLQGRPGDRLGGGQAPLPLELVHQGGQGAGEGHQPPHPLGPGPGPEAGGRAHAGQDQDGDQRDGQDDHAP